MSTVRLVRFLAQFDGHIPSISTSLRDFVRFTKEMEQRGYSLVDEELEEGHSNRGVNMILFFSTEPEQEALKAVQRIQYDLSLAFECAWYDMWDLDAGQIERILGWVDEFPPGFKSFSCEDLNVVIPRGFDEIEADEHPETLRVYTLEWA